MSVSPVQLYLELLKRTLTDAQNIGRKEYYPLSYNRPNWKTWWLWPLNKALKQGNYEICKTQLIREEERSNGYDWPAQALTMVGLNRLNQLEHCMREIIDGNIPGDFMETGVWRGGCVIFMRAFLKVHAIHDRTIWAADSFAGIPTPDAQTHESDKESDLHTEPILNVDLETVKNNFRHFGLLDDRVQFLPGWFRDTLPDAPVQQIALLRLDGDLYESTALALEHLYPKVTTGGFVIIDDYHAFPFCKAAVDDYRSKHCINNTLHRIDQEAVYWIK